MEDLTISQFVREKYWPVFRDGLCPQWQKRSDELIDLLLDDLGNYKLQRLVPEIIERWWIKLRGRFKTPVTPNKVLTRFKHILEAAIRWGYLTNSPAKFLKRVKEPNRKFKLLTPEQEQQLLIRANPRLRLYILFAMYTGARRGSLYQLEEQDVDLTTKTVRFRKTKNGEDVIVPLHPQIEAISERLLTGDKTRKLLPRYESPMAVSQLFRRLCQRCGIDDFRFHDFRHTVGAKMGEAGANPKAIMAMLGHKDIKMTMRYTHIQLDVVRELTTETLARDFEVLA